jgi:predicted secreted protein
MGPRTLLAALLFCLSPGTSFAADAAEREILGFSPDGRYFAFEQYGVQDGSGFPYSEIFVIDLDKDRWLEGTPVRVRLDDESQGLGQARAKALEDARKFLKTARIEDNARVLASNPVSQKTEDARRLVFHGYYTSFGHLEPIDEQDEDVIGLAVEDVVLASPEGCPIGDTPMAGFVLKAKRGPEAFQEMHRDTSIPASRGCPLKYSLSDAVAFAGADGRTQRLVALVNVFSFGFEGADRRFIAVPVQ